jgi:hypothetical protein
MKEFLSKLGTPLAFFLVASALCWPFQYFVIKESGFSTFIGFLIQIGISSIALVLVILVYRKCGLLKILSALALSSVIIVPVSFYSGLGLIQMYFDYGGKK